MAVKGSKRILALKKRRARERESAYIIEGVRLCEEAVRSGGPVEQLIFARDMLDRNTRLSELVAAAEARGIEIQMTDRRAMKGMCETETPQGVIGVVPTPSPSLDSALACGKPLLVLDRINDPGNMGLMLRTAEAAGAGALLILKGSVELYNPKVVRASMGAIFRIPAFPELDPIEALEAVKAASIPIYATQMSAPSYRDVSRPASHALLLGNEAFGVDPDLVARADHTLSIPMAEPVESLNVAVAAAILLYA